MKKQNILKTAIIISFSLYVVLLIWIIVFKFRLDVHSLKYIRYINLVPFKNNGYVNGLRETFINIVLFIPLGMYLNYFFKNNRFLNLGISILTSFSFEFFQYILHIGVSDITDVIMNTLGGFIGIAIIYFSFFITDKVKNLKFLNKLIEYILVFIPIVLFITLFLI